jgi:hypothetical protein
MVSKKSSEKKSAIFIELSSSQAFKVSRTAVQTCALIYILQHKDAQRCSLHLRCSKVFDGQSIAVTPRKKKKTSEVERLIQKETIQKETTT